MRDSRGAVAAALQSGLTVYEDLVHTYMDLHGGLPHLDAEALVGALQANDQAIRVAAITSLSCCVAPST